MTNPEKLVQPESLGFDDKMKSLLGDRYDTSVQQLFSRSPEEEKAYFISELQREIEAASDEGAKNQAISRWIVNATRLLRGTTLMGPTEAEQIIKGEKGDIEKF